MNSLALLLLGISIVNAPRVRAGLGARSASTRMRAAYGGAAVATLVAVGLAAVAHPLIDALDVAPETFRIASAMIITLSALIVMAAPLTGSEALTGQPRDVLVPVAYPLLLGPGPVLTWLVVGVDRGVLPAAGIAAAGYGLAALLAPLPDARRTGWVAAARLLAAWGVVFGVALVIDGVREV